MKRILVWLFAGTVLAGVCLAQSAQSQASGSASQDTAVSAGQSAAHAESNTSATASQATKISDKDSDAQAASASQLQSGSTVQAELTKPLDARKNKVGDEVVAKTTHDVKSNGHVVVPRGSKLIGHVTEVKAHSKDQANSELGIAFDHAVLKNGTEMPLALGIQAIGRAPASAAAMEEDTMASGSAGAVGSSGGRAAGGGGGMLGGVRSTAGGVVNTAGSTAGAATSAAGSAGSAVSRPLASGSLTSTSQGVVGLNGLSLATDASNSTTGSVITSNGSNVHLDSGTQMVLQVTR
jgi:hypothetical protein